MFGGHLNSCYNQGMPNHFSQWSLSILCCNCQYFVDVLFPKALQMVQGAEWVFRVILTAEYSLKKVERLDKYG